MSGGPIGTFAVYVAKTDELGKRLTSAERCVVTRAPNKVSLVVCEVMESVDALGAERWCGPDNGDDDTRILERCIVHLSDQLNQLGRQGELKSAAIIVPSKFEQTLQMFNTTRGEVRERFLIALKSLGFVVEKELGE